MLPLSPAMFIATAAAWLARDDDYPSLTDNELDPLKRDDHRPNDSVMTAAFIGQIGYWAHRQSQGNSVWPFSLDADCDALAQAADECGVLTREWPDPGAILLRWSTVERRFTRASIVVKAIDSPLLRDWTYDCRVVEGTAIRRKAVDGMPDAQIKWVRRARRRCCPTLGDRFISWVDLDARGRTERVA